MQFISGGEAMEKKILICDSSRSLGKMISRRLMGMGLPSDCCKSSVADMQSFLCAGSYRAVIVFAFRPDEKLLDLVSLAEKSGAAVYAGVFAPSSASMNRFLQAGAFRCFPMPCPIGSLCSMIVQDTGISAGGAVQPESFLEELGFPRNLRGFHYLCRAAKLCMEAPQRIWEEGITALYEDIAAHFGTKAGLVERSLRNLADHAFRNGAMQRLTDGRFSEKPTNTELICAVCDILTKRQKDYGK